MAEAKKQNFPWIIILLVAIVIPILLCLCVITCTMVMFIGIGFQSNTDQLKGINEDVFAEICDVRVNELDNIYNMNFTQNFRDDYSPLEFIELYGEYNEFFENCEDALTNISATDYLKGFSYEDGNLSDGRYFVRTKFNLEDTKANFLFIWVRGVGWKVEDLNLKD